MKTFRAIIELMRWVFRQLLRQWYQFIRYIFLHRLIKGKKVLIIGSGLSARKLNQVPEGFLVFTCNRGIKLLNAIKFNRQIDLYFTIADCIENYKEIGENLPSAKIKIFIIDNLSYIKNRPFLKKSCQRLMQDDFANNRYLRSLISGLERVGKLNGSSLPWTSSGMRLLQYALYFKAKEIYLIGLDLDTNGYFDGQPNQSDHVDIDNNVMKVLVEKYNNIHSLTKSAPTFIIDKVREIC